MKTAAILLALLALAGTTLFFQESQTSEESAVFAQYNDWKTKFNKFYPTDEDSYRFQIFYENYLYVKDFNAKHNFSLGVHNQFAALSNDEFRATYTNQQISAEQPKTSQTIIESADYPAGSIDWVAKGAVYPIKNQGQCGSCWAFSAVSSVEGLYYLNTGNLQNFSEQQVVSCEPISYGCNGGWPEAAFAYTANKGLELSSDYPYVQLNNGVTAACKYDASKAVKGVNSSYKNVSPKSNPTAIYQQLQKQPLSILINGGSIVFQLYKGGVIDSSSCGASLDHAVNTVAYDNGVWTIRNSWGTSWGEKGYVRIAWSEGAGYCGINSSVSYPV